MPLTAAQICALSRQDARCPGFTSQSGQLLNMILSDLCQNYDFDLARQSYAFNFNPAQINSQGQAYQNLPANYLRGIRNGSYYTISGVPYPMIPCDQVEEYNMLVEQAGLANFPVFYATDMSLTGVANSPSGSGGALVPVMLFWEVPSGGYPANVYYFSQMPDIATPETSNVVPWFPSQEFLRTELAGQLMKLTDDERADAFLSADEDRHPSGSRVVLRRYLQLKDDKATRVNQVQLDRRRFGASFSRLKNTKSIGWLVPFFVALSLLFAYPAHAQKTKAALTTEVNTNWPDNTVGAITPALLRSTVIDIINSYFDFGGATSFSCPANQWITQVTSLADNIICAQPAFNQLSSYQQNEVSNVDLALVQAYTIKGNPTATNPATPADFTLNSLASKVTPANTDLLFLGDSIAVGPNGGYALKSVPWSSLPGVTGAVTSLNGATGALSLVANNGLTLTVASPNLTLGLTAARRTLPTHQVFLSGSGTYTTPANVLWIEITLVGGGGGGGGGNQTTPGNNGGDTCWNTSGAACTTPVYDAGGGGGSSNSTPGAGGAISGSGTCDWSVPGGRGSGGSQSAAVNGSGGSGGNSSLGGGGGGGFNAVGTAAAVNSGSGGGGGAATATTTAASGYGGSAGATCHVIINGPAASYTYVVGGLGSHAAGGTNGDAGGDGALGQIIVYEHYGS